ncbi:hypothetical protein acsn021_36310 [Anaerocolumna cellulosilytica]|uniref:Uncharacterized protein n=1 Tax=Anaerocolumna cellulosilytica TaxID=433286 RepID=A0A6S6R9X0_9FIRM|nr:hypothetical protein [Anaerocolumna cellulosilytica]MBB5195101.1 hypothetical protein [Anaerocolumna cellulosilytica]BCJ96062.1 hypothetical protein acsn021_36310 [Anaerocolumna cellulosilytica]
MPDTILLQKISEELEVLSTQKHYNKVNNLILSVNRDSSISKEILFKHLCSINKKRYGDWTKIQIERDDISEQAVIFKNLEGE